jgi:DNA-binding response OmpR family regulator
MKRFTALLAEDEALIAYDVEATLSAAGFEVLGPYGTVAEAQERVLHETPALAVVDILLRDHSAVNMIEDLRRRGVPVVIVSGLDAADYDQDEHVPWLTKPIKSVDLLLAIDQVMANKKPAEAGPPY